jgi:D-alanyl-D-alanine carboxypeptidase
MPPSPLVRRRRATLGLFVAIASAAVLLWPAGDAVPVRTLPGSTASGYRSPPNYLAWIPGGFEDPRFRSKIERVGALDDVVVVEGDTLWLRRTEDAGGRVVDDPAGSYAFPIDAFAVQPSDYAPFVGASVRARLVAALRAGHAVLGTHSARLRHLGAGGVLRFRRGSVRVGTVVPDDAVGWSEVMVSRAVGRRLGITHERYVLAHPRDHLTRRAWRRIMLPFAEGNGVRVEVPGATRYVRVASGVNPPILVKLAFGEFAAVPQADPVYLTIQPSWVERNIVTTRVPLLGAVTCNRRLIPMVRGALEEVIRRGLGPEIKVYSGCWAARTVARSPTAPPSTHAYGAAIDINAPQSPYGAKPRMNPEVVRIFERWGFNWGGDFLIPDGHHFEFWRFPDRLRPS